MLLGGDDDKPSPRQLINKPQRDLLESVRARFGLTKLHLLAQPLAETKRMILEVKPELRNQPDPFQRLPKVLEEYGREA